MKINHTKFNTPLHNSLMKGWEKAGAAGIAKCESTVPHEGPFEEIDTV